MPTGEIVQLPTRHPADSMVRSLVDLHGLCLGLRINLALFWSKSYNAEYSSVYESIYWTMHFSILEKSDDLKNILFGKILFSRFMRINNLTRKDFPLCFFDFTLQ